MNEPVISQPHGMVDESNPHIKWVLKAGVWFCFVDDCKIFELKQGVGKWSISALGRTHLHLVALDPELAKTYALHWFVEECQGILKCLGFSE